MQTLPPAIGYDNILTATNVSATGYQTGHPPSALANSNTADTWRADLADADIQIDAGTPVLVDYFGIAAHNLYLFGGVVLLYGNNNPGLSGTPVLLGSVTIGSTGIPVADIFDNSNTYRYFTVRILPDTLSDADADYLEVGAINIGLTMNFERCARGSFTPPQYSRRTKKTTTQSQSAAILGRTIERYGAEGSFSFDQASAGWCRTTYQAFVLAARTQNFFFWWNPGKYPDEVNYCYAPDDIRWAYTGTGAFANSSFDMRCVGYYE